MEDRLNISVQPSHVVAALSGCRTIRSYWRVRCTPPHPTGAGMTDGDLLLNHFLDSVNSISALGDASVGGFRRSSPSSPTVQGPRRHRRRRTHPTRPPGATLAQPWRAGLRRGSRCGRARGSSTSADNHFTVRAPRWSPGSVAKTVTLRTLMPQHCFRRVARLADFQQFLTEARTGHSHPLEGLLRARRGRCP
jgi:hypothetical protein